jgi:hypothetical protein
MRSAISSMACSQEICSNSPLPRSPVRFMGCITRTFSSWVRVPRPMERKQQLA